MKPILVPLMALIAFVSPSAATQEKKPEMPPHVTMPSPPTPTIPSDAMFALGQQSIQLQAISAKLEKMEPDVSQERRDIDRLLFVYNMFSYSIGLIISIVASYVLVRLIKKFWPEPPTSSPTV